MRRLAFGALITVLAAGPTLAGPAPTAAPPARGPVLSASPLPTLDSGTYARIGEAMLSYAAIDVRGGWPAIPKTAAELAPGVSDPAVAALRQRLLITEDLDAAAANGELFDDDLAEGLRRFQARHGLPGTGRVDKATLAALNVPVRERLRQLGASLDRLGGMNFQFGQRYVVVNIPSAIVEAVNGDVVERRHIVVVGKPDRPSPTLTTRITAVNLNPTWTVPLSIVKKDIVTRMRRDPGYISRMRMKVLDATGGEISPQSIDWKSLRAPNFTIRQDSGNFNALGNVRIDMPNPHAVYMHDTNHRNLFRSDYRFHSSGCTRVADVRELAAWLLNDQPAWDRKAIDATIAKGQRLDIRLDRPVPVAWVYMTGWVTRDGAVHFRNDVYGHDAEPPAAMEISVARPMAVARATGFVLQSAEAPAPQFVQSSYLDSR